MGERLLCKQEVIGSIPFTSTSGTSGSGPSGSAPCGVAPPGAGRLRNAGFRPEELFGAGVV